MDITREEFNGLGNRVDGIKDIQSGCIERTNTRLTRVESDGGELRDNITRLFQSQERTNIELATLSASMKTWGAALVVLSPIIAALVSFIMAKIV